MKRMSDETCYKLPYEPLQKKQPYTNEESKWQHGLPFNLSIFYVYF